MNSSKAIHFTNHHALSPAPITHVNKSLKSAFLTKDSYNSTVKDDIVKTNNIIYTSSPKTNILLENHQFKWLFLHCHVSFRGEQPFKIIYTLSNLQFSAFKISKKVDTKADTEIDSSPWYKGRHHSGVVEQYLHLTSHLMNEEFQQIANADIMYADICRFNTWISWIGIYC